MGVKKFLCRHKGKFGLNMQGVCDAKGRFLDVPIGYPGSALDYLAFVASALRTKAETLGFLAPGLVLHGDNAYASNNNMATLYKNVKSGSKDACNFYQSQLRMCAECAFSMLVHQ